jgi:N-acetylneuraminic acid mutarotase
MKILQHAFRRGFALAIGLAASVAAQDVGRWITSGIANIPKARANPAFAMHEGKIHILGGFDPWPNPSSTNYVYDIKANTWSTAAAMPVALHHPGPAAFLNGKIYVMGGVDYGRGLHPNGAEWLGSRHAQEYDIATNKWRVLKDLPRTTGAAGVVAFDGKIYVMGGVDINGIVHTENQIYDPATDTWTKGKAMPTARDHPGVVAVGDKLYVGGGSVLKKNIPVFEAYSPKTDTWETLPPMLHTRSDIGFVHVKGRLYSFGGEWPGIYDDNEEYDIAAKKWRVVQKMPRPWKAMAALNVNDTVWSFGGFTDAGITAQVIRYIPPVVPVGLKLDLTKAPRARFRFLGADPLLEAVDVSGRRRSGGPGWDAVRLFIDRDGANLKPIPSHDVEK